MKNILIIIALLGPLCACSSMPNRVQKIKERVPNGQNGKVFIKEESISASKKKFWLNHFLHKNRARFQRFIDNSGKYRNIVMSILDKNNLPRDLFFVAFIESGFYSHTRSRSQAKGPWQFMKGTARDYGLTVGRGIDERVNIFKATQSAANYLADLYNIFGEWELALSAYNAGENRIINIIKKHNIRNYAELSQRRLLPKETINYIPKLAAAMEIVQNSKKYGFIAPKHKTIMSGNFRYFPIKKSVTMKKLASKLNIPLSIIKSWNSGVLGDRIYASRRKKFSLIVSKKIYNRLIKNPSIIKFATIKYSPKKSRRKRIFYRIKRGDNLTTIANKFKVSINRIKGINGLTSSKIIYGRRLRIH